MGKLWWLALAPVLAVQVGDIEVRARLNRQTAQVGETVLLTVTLRAHGLHSPEIEDPKLEGFEVLSSSDRSTFRFSPSLGSVREFAREYTLRVLQQGELTIPPIRVAVADVLYETEALNLVAESEGTTAIIPGGLQPRPEEEVAVRLWVEPETAYVGQQVTLTVAAFFDPLVRSRLQRQPEYRPPEVQGFWTADLPGSMRPERRVLGRREYFVQVYRRALFPLSSGVQRVPPAAVVYEVRRGLIYAPETFQVESAPATVVVRALPTEGAPPDFAGAVGRYDAEIWLDRSDLRAGEAVNLFLEVRGSGNLSALARPPLPEIPGVRVYEGGEDAEVQLRGVEFAGHKQFSWVLVPERAGQYFIPELRLSYFDPVEAAFALARTEPISLLVEPATMATVKGTGGTAIRFVKAETGRQPLGLAAQRGFWIAQAVPLLAFVFVLVLGRYRLRAPHAARRRPRRRQQALKDLRPLAESGDPAFFSQLRARLLEWLGERLHRPQLSSQGVVQLQNTLEDAGVPPNVALELVGLLERCGRLRYTPDPVGADLAAETLAEARRLLAQVDREAVSERSLRAASARGGSLLLTLAAYLALVAWVPRDQQTRGREQEADRWFAEAVTAYGEGEYREAAELLESVLAERPRDPNLLYNLGNAYYELDERGKAVAYWIRALRLRPRDRDARFNLRLLVGDDPVVGSALAPLPLSRDELALLFMLFWFVGWGALIARRRRVRGHLTGSGVASLTLAALCAVLLLFPRGEYAIIASPDTALRAGPVRQSEVLASPAPGTGYQVTERRDVWLRVSRGGDSEGWVEREKVELID